MVVHVGIGYFFISLPVSTYDTINKTHSNFELDSPIFSPSVIFKEVLESDIEDIDQMFTEIKLKIDGELGCVCIVLDSPRFYRFYNYFVTSAVSHGFKNFQIIDTTSALFYGSLWDLINLPENCDIIQQKRSTKHFKLWQKRSGIVTLKDSINFNKTTIESKIREGLLSDEAIVIHHKNTSIEQMKNYFPNFDYFSVEGYEKNVGALYKARMMGSDPYLNYFDVESKHGTSVILQIDDVEILRIEYGEILPLRKIFEYELPAGNSTLTVITSKDEKKAHSIPNWRKIVILLCIRKDKTFFITMFKHYKNSLEFERVFKTRWDTYAEISDIYHFPVKIQVNNDEINAFGIDLGTTRCCAAVNRKNGIETVALENTGGRLLPSYVAFDEDHDKCGQIVIDRLRNFGKFSIFDAKRIIGKRYDEIKMDEAWPFEVKKHCYTHILSDGKKYDSEETVTEVMTSKGATLKFLDEISATLLKHIKKCAEEFQRKHLNEVVVTVPAAFNKMQTKATFNAAIHAGFDNAYLLPEPVAAAFAYFIDRSIPNNSTLLIFDLGGGTLDVCIFKIEKNQLKIISRSGDPNIGGRDFDNLIVSFFEEKLTQNYGTEMTDVKRLKLLLKCQNLKESLSTLEEANLDADEIDPSVETFIPITRNQFEEMSANLVQEIRLNVEKALNKINLQSYQIQKVLQVGGGCRMPMIKALLKEMFPNSEHCADQNPDEVVAIGAAYYAYYLNQKDKSKCSVM